LARATAARHPPAAHRWSVEALVAALQVGGVHRAVVSRGVDSHNALDGHSTALLSLNSMPKRSPRITVPELVAYKASGRKIAMLTAYDYPTAALLDAAGIDAILVGDSMSMVVQGHDTTLPVTLEEMLYHAEMVGRAVEHALVVVDLPFPTNHLGVPKVIESAGRILKETRCHAVKLEGGADQADVIAGLVAAGIPVMAHVGLRPQSVHQMGGYRVQRDARRLHADAQAAQDAGAFAVVLECIPGQVAAEITAGLKIPTIGIGAGPQCDGQVLVIHDLLGLTAGYVPRFVRQYADLKATIQDAVKRYHDDVNSGRFPGPEQEFH
jgi:3-methyl-2-oxobutanoate hydroxymethyltransferase